VDNRGKEKGGKAPNVVLVSLPWTTLTEPSLGLGTLRAVLDGEGIACRVWHLNLFMLQHVRAATYCAIANVFGLNDFVFSGVLDPTLSHRQLRVLRGKTRELLSHRVIDDRRHGGPDWVIDQIINLRQEVVPRWLGECADEIVGSGASLVGLTCMFDQTVASLALAQLVKQRSSSVMVALGGYAVRSPTAEALIRSFPAVDAVCVTDGEGVIGGLARASVGAISLGDVPGLCIRGGEGTVRTTPSPPVVDMDTVPTPNFDDFYADVRRLADDHQIEITVERLPVENSRGCWWGASKHCVFCGINDDDMAFRLRSADLVLETLDALHARHGVTQFRFSDYILPRQYYTTLLPALVERGSPYGLTAEMKANVTPSRFALLASAGFSEVQPGIESFSTSVLRNMDKGVGAAQNVLTLLLGKSSGVRVHYNILYGLPSDLEDDYELMVRNLPRLCHLDPPSTRLEVQITRHAPLQTDPGRFGIPQAVYEPSYDLVFSADFNRRRGFDLNDYCYYFARPFENAPRLQRLYQTIDRLVDHWRAQHRERAVELRFVEGDDGRRTVFDSRRLPARETVLTDEERDILRLCREPVSLRRLKEELSGTLDAATVEAVVDHLDEEELVFRDRDLVLSLVVPVEVGDDPPSDDGSAGEGVLVELRR